ncbi:serine aminopeptidase domain-containing protein [Nocardia sp. NPDC057030]|uniref:alpha/beta hydrolase n=1 Tax=unclassified Nocardia TaxID=2637762 RepID=UPI003627D8E7
MRTVVESDRTIPVRVAELLRDGEFERVAELFGAPLRAAVSPDALRGAWLTEIGRIGPVRAIGLPAVEPFGDKLIRANVPVTGERGGFALIMSIDAAGLLHGLRLADPAAAWAPPDYADPSLFAEREITVGSGELAVPGTLSVPHGPGPWPAVVLLHGGGPFDRDETCGPNKPLKDLAWGLAGRGIAVLRFDKVTYAHPRVAERPDFTMADEYVPHAVSAVDLLRRHPGVDPALVFVLGHSMGGKVAPRVAAAEPSVAGLVLLAADAEPMHHAAVRVLRYLASVTPGPEVDAMLAAATRGAAVVDGPELSRETPSAELPFGMSGAYWLDLRDYDQVATAAALPQPMLIVQGGRDYQVTVDDDLARWQAGLALRTDVTTRVYPADNHLFFPGTGPSTPADYEAPQHVDPTVVSDIAEWLARQAALTP